MAARVEPIDSPSKVGDGVAARCEGDAVAHALDNAKRESVGVVDDLRPNSG